MNQKQAFEEALKLTEGRSDQFRMGFAHGQKAALEWTWSRQEDLRQFLIRELPAGTIIGNPEWWVPRIMKTLTATNQYDEENPLGGPAKVFDAMAAAIRAGDSFESVLSQFGFSETVETEQAIQPALVQQLVEALENVLAWDRNVPSQIKDPIEAALKAVKESSK